MNFVYHLIFEVHDTLDFEVGLLSGVSIWTVHVCYLFCVFWVTVYTPTAD
jgi:hypothetical protein